MFDKDLDFMFDKDLEEVLGVMSLIYSTWLHLYILNAKVGLRSTLNNTNRKHAKLK